MTYRDPRQSLEDPARKVSEAIGELERPIMERISHPEDWTDTHIEEMLELSADLARMKVRLIRLATKEW
jgi:hypothetical protein